MRKIGPDVVWLSARQDADESLLPLAEAEVPARLAIGDVTEVDGYPLGSRGAEYDQRLRPEAGPAPRDAAPSSRRAAPAPHVAQAIGDEPPPFTGSPHRRCSVGPRGRRDSRRANRT